MVMKLFRREQSTILAIDTDLEFSGVIELKNTTQSMKIHKFTIEEIVRYLYGYYASDRTRRIFLVRKAIHLQFFNAAFERDVSLHIPKGTVSLSFGFTDLERGVHPYLSEIPPSVKVLKFRHMKYPDWEEEDDEENVINVFEVGVRTGSPFIDKDFPQKNNIRIAKEVEIGSIEDLSLFHKKFGIKLAITSIILKMKSIPSQTEIQFRRCKRMRIELEDDSSFRDYSWIPSLFPNLGILKIKFPTSNINNNNKKKNTMIHDSLFSVLRKLGKLRKLDIYSTGREFTFENLRVLLHKNQNLKELGIDLSISKSSIFTNFENSCLESLSIFREIEGSHLIPEKISVELLLTFFRSLSSLEHFEIACVVAGRCKRKKISINSATLRRLAKGEYVMNNRRPDSFIEQLRFLQNGGGRYSQNDNDEVKYGILQPQVIMDFFMDPSHHQHFFSSLKSLSLYLPFTSVPEEFFKRGRFEKLEKISLSVLNELDLVKTIGECCDSLVIPKLREFRIGTKLLPGHFSLISEKMKSLRILTLVDFDSGFRNYISHYFSNIRIVDTTNRNGDVIHQNDPYELIDPLKRYNFYDVRDPKNENNIVVNSKNEVEDENLLKSIEKWGLQPPYTIKGVDWEDYYKTRIEMEENRKNVVSSGEWWPLIDDEDMEKMVSKDLLEKYLEDLDNFFFLDRSKNKNDKSNIRPQFSISCEEIRNLKNSMFLQIDPQYRGYEIESKIYSQIGNGHQFHFNFKYESSDYVYLQSLDVAVDKFYNPLKVGVESIERFEKREEYNKRPSRFSKGKTDLHQIFVMFPGNSPPFDTRSYRYESKYFLRKLEKGILGRNDVFKFGIRDFVQFLYLVTCTHLPFFYGGDDYEAETRRWVLRMAEFEYGYTDHPYTDLELDGEKKEFEWKRENSYYGSNWWKEREEERKKKVQNGKTYFERENYDYFGDLDSQFKRLKERIERGYF